MSRELSELDRVVLVGEGARLPGAGRCKKRISASSDGGETTSSGEKKKARVEDPDQASSSASTSEAWEEVQTYLDPNPQLKGQNAGVLQEKVSPSPIVGNKMYCCVMHTE